MVTDTLIDGTRSDPLAPVYSENGTDADVDGNIESAWFFEPSAGATLSASAGHLVGTVGASSASWTTYFTPEASPITLAKPGDQLRVTWVFTLTGVNSGNTNQDFRLAVVDTPAVSRLTGDIVPSAASNYTGYGMLMNLGQTLGGAAPFQLGRRVAGTLGTLLGSAGSYTVLTNASASGRHGYDDGMTYTYVMTLTRNAAGGLVVTSTMTGGSLDDTGSVTVSVTDPMPPGYAFDTFQVRPSTGASTTASSFDTTLFRVEFLRMPVVQFESTASHGLETASPAVLKVALSQVMTQAVSVNYAVVGGTASNGADYALAPGTLVFNPGETNKTISMPVTNDGLADNGETVVVNLKSVQTERPGLQIVPSAGGTVLSWPADLAGCILESRTDLASLPYWTAVTNQTAVSNGLCQVTVPSTGQGQYFRLRAADSAAVQLGVQSNHTFTIVENNQLVVRSEFVGISFSPFNHVSSIAQTADGSFVVTWMAGSSEGASDVSIWVSRNTGNGWSPRVEVDSGPPSGGADWNPVLCQPKSGPLLLFYKYGGAYNGGWEGSIRTSGDSGATWSDRIPLPATTNTYFSEYAGRFVGPTKNRPLELPDGRLLCGSSTEDSHGWRAHMEIASPTNNYTTNYQTYPVGGFDGIQPTFLVHDDNYQKIQAILRPNGTLPAKVTWSYDGGSSWSTLTTMPLTVYAGLHALTVNNLNSASNRWHILAYNVSSTRDPLKIAISQNGTNWTVAVPSFDSGGRMDYPTLMQSSDKLIHMTYSYGTYTKIKHVVLDPYVLLNETRP